MAAIEIVESGLEVHLPQGTEPAPISWHWLRDHGEDEASQDPDTGQRRVDTFALGTVPAGTASVDGGGVGVTWPEGITTRYSTGMLFAVAAEYLATDWLRCPDVQPTVPTDVTLWAKDSAAAQDLELEAFLDPNSDETLAVGVDQIARLGYLVLRSDEVARDRAESFANRLGYVRNTIFGGLWDLAPDLTGHADSAYTNVFLAPHTDGTYSHDAPGYQFFLCLEAAAAGGESLLVDGFAIAEELRRLEPEIHTTLASIPVPGRYVEPGVHLRAERPVLRRNARGVVDQVSFNNYDRAPFLLPPDLEQRFYQAYGRFAEMAFDPSRRLAVGLTPGDILIFDNWRVLHGRSAFTGFRHYVGAYLNHEDVESKRRVLFA